MKCPKCGSSPEWFVIQWGLPSTMWFLQCPKCGRNGPQCGTKKSALKAWGEPQNMREMRKYIIKKYDEYIFKILERGRNERECR